MRRLSIKSVLKELYEQDAEQAPETSSKPEEKGVVTSGDPQPGDAPPNKQLHVFDFDDTIGVTQDANGLMVYKDGVPLKTPQEMDQWLTSKGIGGNYMLKGPKGSSIEQPDGVEGVAAYINSAGLAKAREGLGKDQIKVSPAKPTPGDPKSAGEVMVADYSPSATAKAAVPIESTLDKIKSLPAGATSQIITARTGESKVASAAAEGQDRTPKDFSGKAHPPSVEADLKAFMDQQGAKLTNGVKGLGGGDKGEAIKKLYFDGKPPEQQPDEVHFYDDDSKNISDVQNALAGKVPAEVFLYGPGEFAHGAANPENPSKEFPAATEETVKEYRLRKLNHMLREAKEEKLKRVIKRLINEEYERVSVKRWQLLAGMKKR